MKRSNRLIILIGIFLAIVAFVGVFYLLQQSPSTDGGGGQAAQESPTVFAKIDIPLGTTITPTMVETKPYPNNQRAANAYPDSTLVIGKVARQDIVAGAQLTSKDFATGVSGSLTPPDPGYRAVSVLVDQVTGVGTLIAPGDYVDMIVAFTGEKFRDPSNFPPVNSLAGGNGTTSKVLLQGMRVLGILLPPPPETPEGSPAPEDGTTTTLSGQQEIVIVEVDAQQAEIIKFAQLEGSISLALRTAADFTDPSDPTKRIVPIPDATSGIVLRNLLDAYEVLTPEIVDILLPQEPEPVVIPEVEGATP